MKRTIIAALVALSVIPIAARQRGAGGPPRERVTFKSGHLTLEGFLFKPEGPGSFPALIWNHGSEQHPEGGPQFDAVARIFVPAGYVVFAPVRRGHGASEGTYITSEIERARQTRGGAPAQLMVHLMETEQLEDQLAGLSYVKSLPYVDQTRLAVAGCSYGGIETLLAAERGTGFKAAVAISPAALSWDGNPLLRERLVKAVRRIEIPVMLLQPPKDASLEPSHVLGAEFTKLGKRYVGKIYPAEGPEDEQGHCFGGAKGMHIWAADAVTFLADALRSPR